MGRSGFLLVQMKDRQSWSCGEAARVMLASNSVLRASSPAASPADSVLRENNEPAMAPGSVGADGAVGKAALETDPCRASRSEPEPSAWGHHGAQGSTGMQSTLTLSSPSREPNSPGREKA